MSYILNRSYRSLLVQFRSGISPLKVETGRYQNLPPEFRLCLMCNKNDCSLYDNIRCNYFSKITQCYSDFTECTTSDKLKLKRCSKVHSLLFIGSIPKEKRGNV